MEGFDLRDQTPLYHHTDSYAQEHGELDRYHASYQANIACKEAIEQAIAHNNADNPQYGAAERAGRAHFP